MLAASELDQVGLIRRLAEFLHAPRWLVAALTGFAAVVLLMIVLIKLLKRLWHEVRPIALVAHGRRADLNERTTYCRWLESQLTQLSAVENMRDVNYAELEAEVEIERRRRLPLTFGSQTSQRVRSLSIALEKVRATFCVLEGDPGAGKSVALRRVALDLARHGRGLKGHVLRRPLPMYINLKDMDSSFGVNPQGVQSFVLSTIADASSDIVDIVSRRFPEYMKAGRVVFLMDSFDEIPEVLNATAESSTPKDYAIAIHDWLPPKCRLVVASRHFHGPRRLPGVRFQIVRLSPERQRLLVKHAFLGAPRTRELRERLAGSEPWVTDVAPNPMWLSLLVDHVRSGGALPSDTAPPVFETFINRRLALHVEQQRHRAQSPQFSPNELRDAAERLAYVMTSDGLGLRANRASLKASLENHELWGCDFPDRIDELIRLKIMRSGPSRTSAVTYTHRRLQERLTTDFLLKHEEPVPPDVLLSEGRWREIAVALCQGAAATTQTLLLAIQHQLASQAEQVHLPTLDLQVHSLGDLAAGNSFCWPANSKHLLGILTDASPANGGVLSLESRQAAGLILRGAALHGGLIDRKLAVTFSSTADTATQLWLVENAFTDGNQWLGDAAYTQVGRLCELTGTTAQAIRRALIGQWGSGQLRAAGLGIVAEINRIRNPGPFLALRRLLLMISPIDLLLLVVAGASSLLVVSRKNRITEHDYALVSGLVICAWLGFSLLRATVFARTATPRGLSRTIRTIGRLIMPGSYHHAQTVAVSFFVLTRLALAGTLVSGTWESVHGGLTGALITVLVVYCTTWVLTAVAMAHTRRYVRTLTWPFLPLALLWLIGSQVPRLLTELRRLGWRKSLLTTLFLVAYLALIKGAERLHVPPGVARKMSYAIGAMAILIIVGLLCWGAWGLFRRVKDRRNVDKWAEELRNSSSGREPVDETAGLVLRLERVRTVYGAHRIMLLLRHGRLLSGGRPAAFLMDFVTAVGFAAEADRKFLTSNPLYGLPVTRPAAFQRLMLRLLDISPKDPAPAIWPHFQSQEFRTWFEIPAKRKSILQRFKGEALEEACRAVESASD